MSAAVSRRRRRSTGSAVAAQHAEWLALIEVSGPFLSLGVLLEAFPQGLDADDPELAARLRQALDEWQANCELRRPDPALHQAFVRFIVSEVLGYTRDLIAEGPAIPELLKATPPEARAPIRPDLTVGRPGEKPILLVSIHEPATPLDRPLAERGFHASPDERMRQLLRETGIASGVVTNSEKWTLVHAPPDQTATFATWDANDLLDERLTLRAFRSLLGIRRTLGESPESTLDGLLERSRDDQREVTDRLGVQTRRAVETLVATIDRADRETDGRVVEAVRALERNEEAERTLYEAAVVVAMRIVFLLAAEARDLLPSVEDWTRAYAVTPLRSELEAVADRSGEELLDHRYDAWPRLLATFRAVHGGITHDRVRLIGYGGGLFDPARYPFLEVATGRPHGISNRVVLRVLESLQTLEVDIPGGGRERRPLSYRALGVEQIGHVYERLLDHTAIRATAPAVGLLGSARKEPERALDVLDAERAKGEEAFLAYLKEETGRNLRSRLAAKPAAGRLERLAIACGHDEALAERVRPYLGIVRDDGYDLPTVIHPGSVFVTQSDERHATGTHYTPPSLTEPIVKHALDPLVYDGPADGKPETEWKLRPPTKLLALKVCDMAMGSAAFLVAAARYLGARLVTAWDEHPDEAPDDLPADVEERELVARRLVAERCLYGVDRNPLAVEIAKVSLWLETLQKDRPFTFLDHALRAGDSLVGVTDLRQLEDLSLRPQEGTFRLETDPARAAILSAVSEARTLRERIEATDAVDLRDVAEKAAFLDEAERTTARLRQVGDVVCGVALREVASRDLEAPRDLMQADAEAIAKVLAGGEDDGSVERAAMEHLLVSRAPGDPSPLQPFHWALEFPEVLEREKGGFDAIVGNPPFVGGVDLAANFGIGYERYLKSKVPESRGFVDLAVYFHHRATELAWKSGVVCLLGPQTFKTTANRRAGPDVIVSKGRTISWARSSVVWPGEASLEICAIRYTDASWEMTAVLDGRSVASISSALQDDTDVSSAHRLQAWIDYSQGTDLYGAAFIKTEDEWSHFVTREPDLARFMRPYVNAQILCSFPSFRTDLLVPDFGESNREDLPTVLGAVDHLEAAVGAERAGQKRQIHERRPWLFWDKRTTAYRDARRLGRVLVCPNLSKHVPFLFVNPNFLFSKTVKLIITDGYEIYALLESTFFLAWVHATSPLRGGSIAFSTSSSLDTFVPPTKVATLAELGEEHWRARSEAMLHRKCGVTTLLNRVHDADEAAPEIVNLRDIQCELDNLVARAYGWSDLKLDHDHRETPLGIRFTVSRAIRTKVLERLLELNHARHAKEVAQGLHGARRSRRQ